MAAHNVLPKLEFLDGKWLPSPSKITYQNFNHWEAAMMYSQIMSQWQSRGQHLRHLSTRCPTSPAFTPQPIDDSDSSDSQVAQHVDPDIPVVRLARNRPALDSLRRTHKMRYRRNLRFLAESFPLADERAAQAGQARKEVEMDAQAELAKKKSTEKAVEELRLLREMKAAKMKEKADQRLKEKAAWNDSVEGKTEKPTAIGPRKTVAKNTDKATGAAAEKTMPKAKQWPTCAGTAKEDDRNELKKAEKALPESAKKTATKSAAKAPEKPVTYIKVRNIFEKTPPREAEEAAPKRTRKKPTPKGTQKPAHKSTQEEATGKTREAEPKSTAETAAKRSGKKSLRAKMMPKYSRWR